MKNIKFIVVGFSILLFNCNVKNGFTIPNSGPPQKVKVDLPKETKSSQREISIVITKENKCYIENELVLEKNIEQVIMKFKDSLYTDIIGLYGDKESQYRLPIKIITIAKSHKMKVKIKTSDE